jgi:hypothetical protein
VNRPGEAKPMFSALPQAAVLETAKPMMHGIAKHGFEDWRYHDPVLFEDAMMRHKVARSEGELRDPETGELHAAHMAANALIVVAHELILLEDDRRPLARLFADRRTAAFNRDHPPKAA